MKGQSIILASNPRGFYIEGTIDTASLPGTHMQMVLNSTFGDTRPHYTPLSISASGNPALIAILLEDDKQGATSTTAHQAGKRCRMYVPAAGEEMNILVGTGSGTGDYTVGEKLMVASGGSGYATPVSGTPISTPWEIQEPLDGYQMPGLIWCRYTGH